MALACAACTRQEQRFDSVLLITLDTLRADHVSCYGPSPVSTPSLDALARRGARATRAWTPAPLTTPAHATILSGLYPPAHGVRTNARFRLPDEVTTLPEILHTRGVHTAAFVASFTTAGLFGLSQGFEVYDDDMGNDPIGGRRAQRPGNEVTDRAIAWLAANAGRPFLLWVHLYDPHAPYEPPAEYGRRFPGDPYSGEVAFADAQVGRLVAALDASGAAPRTAIVVAADHGEGLGTHGEDLHGFLLYEEALRIPLLLVAPGRIMPGSQLQEVASLVDLTPTILGILEVTTPGEVRSRLQGRDLLAPQTVHPSLYAETLYPKEEFGWSALYALREGDLKYVAGPTPELFDLAADAAETSNRSDARVDDARRLAGALRVEAARLAEGRAQLAAAADLGKGPDAEAVARLESLGYVAGGATAGESSALAGIGGRAPRAAMADYARFKQAQEQMRQGRHAEAARLLAALAASDPDNPQFLLKTAQALDRAGRSRDAETRFRDLLRRHPGFYLGYGFFSDYLDKERRYDDARQVWLDLLATQPAFVGATIRLAQVEIAGGRAGDAARRLDAHVADHAEDASAWAHLGRARARLGQGEPALTAFERALALHPTEGAAVEGAVDLLLASGRRDAARRLVARLEEKAPGDALLVRLARDLR
jgi:arylsulfatase A-like enzyme